MTKEKWVNELLGRMNLEQKVGQLMVFGFCGSVITPDIVDMIQKYHIGGFRISQKFRCLSIMQHDVKPGTPVDDSTARSIIPPQGNMIDYAYTKNAVHTTPREYAQVLNRLRDYALERPLGVPLHFTIDQEGNASDDMLSGQHLFPHPMGLAASGDPEIAYKAAVSIARQVRALGVNMIHSPTLDVNTNPKNPEIGSRAYGSHPDVVAQYALQTLKGFQENKLMATGKHFPGRGESEADAHWGLPVVNLNLKQLLDTHMYPYKKLIAAGLPAIMIAHSCYPALGIVDKPAGMSKELIDTWLRGEFGFKGVITTDSMTMGGVLKKYEMSEAIIQMLLAGCDLILCREQTPLRIKVLENVVAAVREGRLPEKRIDESVERILKMRWDMGLADNGGKVDVEQAETPIHDSYVVHAAQEAAEKSTVLLRDEQSLLPLGKEQNVLLIEQIFPTHEFANNMYSHPGLLWEEMCALSSHVGSVEIPYVPAEQDRQRALRRVEEADVIVMTNYYYHKNASASSEFVREVQKSGKPVIVVTNTPYEMGAPADFPTVITSFNPGGRECLSAVAKTIFGELKPRIVRDF